MPRIVYGMGRVLPIGDGRPPLDDVKGGDDIHLRGKVNEFQTREVYRIDKLVFTPILVLDVGDGSPFDGLDGIDGCCEIHFDLV